MNVAVTYSAAAAGTPAPGAPSVQELMRGLGRAAVAAAAELALAGRARKDRALLAAAAAVRRESGAILAANAHDLRAAGIRRQVAADGAAAFGGEAARQIGREIARERGVGAFGEGLPHTRVA